jgi:uncharacterized DUF497 family protein
MSSRFTWNDVKRAKNLAKHGLDFGAAGMVLDNPYRLDVSSVRKDETREQSFAFVFERLAVPTVVHMPGVQPHIISFRPASRVEREIYHEWLENDFDGS